MTGGARYPVPLRVFSSHGTRNHSHLLGSGYRLLVDETRYIFQIKASLRSEAMDRQSAHQKLESLLSSFRELARKGGFEVFHLGEDVEVSSPLTREREGGAD